MQTDLDMNDHHKRGVLVDENDQKSAVSVGYLEKGLLKVRDKVNNELFDSFVDFRKLDSYNVKWGGGGGDRRVIFSVKKRFLNFNLSHN